MIRRGFALAFVFLAACGGGNATGPGGTTPSSSSSGGTSSDGAPPAPVNDSVAAPPPTSLDCGDFSTCAVGGDGIVRCWGRNKDGELGQAEATKDSSKRAAVPGLGKVTKIALASQLSCAILENKHVRCWGSGKLPHKVIDNGQPTEIEGIDDAEEIEASGAIVCARGAKGIKCWGEDEKSIGVPPAGAYKQITTGFTHGCALDEKGSVACWGIGPDWGPKGKYANPGVTGALHVATGDRHACIIAKDKTVQCWGMNDSGQLGMKPDFTPHPKPTAVPGVHGATKLFAGETANCALTGEGVKCWGSNNEGELGLGKQSTDERPSFISGISGAEHLCFASAHACALTQDHKLFCWGSNNFGQIGDGTKERRTSPTPVTW